jgi:hypothetical protein
MSPTKTQNRKDKAPEETMTPAAAGGAPAPTIIPSSVGTLPAARDGAAAAPALSPPDAIDTGVEAQAAELGGITAWQTATVGALYTTNNAMNAWVFLNAVGWRRLSPTNASGHQLMLELCRLSRDSGAALQVDEDGSVIKTVYLW